jgi:glutamate/tyrosine decarboxylase-like PLP-dependent enzyme
VSSELSRIRAELGQLAERASALDPPAAVRQAHALDAVAHAERFLSGIQGPSYRSDQGSAEAVERFGIPESPRDLAEVLDVLAEHVDAPGVAVTSPRYLGFVPAGGLYHSALGDFLAAVSNRYSGLASISPGAAGLERTTVRWLADQLGLPPTADGTLTSGGSVATLSAVVAAREAAGMSATDIARQVVYVTDQTHHSLDKALRISGLADVVRRVVAVDHRGRMDPAALADTVHRDQSQGLHPWLLVGTAGTTGTGAVDPLSELAEVAERHGLWFHVDGAYGGLFALCPEGRRVLGGIERADTLVVDPHKTLFLPYGTGALLARDREHLRYAFSASADYLPDPADDADSSPADLSVELTRHFRALRLWLPLQLAGGDAVRAALSEKIRLARYLHHRLDTADGFEVGPEPDLSIATYRFHPPTGDVDQFNETLSRTLQREGEVFVSHTRVRGRIVLRAAVLSFRTHLDDVDRALAAITSTARRLATGVPPKTRDNSTRTRRDAHRIR